MGVCGGPRIMGEINVNVCASLDQSRAEIVRGGGAPAIMAGYSSVEPIGLSSPTA